MCSGALYNGRMRAVLAPPSGADGLPHNPPAARWLNLAGLVTWFVCALQPLARATFGAGAVGIRAAFFAAFALFGLALVGILYLQYMQARSGLPRGLVAILLMIESLAGMTLIVVSGH